jgi:DNA-binding MarR family transcriptional regulator
MRNQILGKFLSFLGRKTHQELDRILSPLQVSSSTYRVLIKAHHQPGITQNQIATAFNVDKANISRAVSKLIQQGFLKKKKAADRRNFSLYLTKQGQIITKKVISNMKNWQERVLSDFSKQEEAQLFSYLQKMAENIQRIEGENART